MQHIITRRVSKKNSNKEVVEYTRDGNMHAKYVGDRERTKAAFIAFKNSALDNVAYDGGTVVVRDKR